MPTTVASRTVTLTPRAVEAVWRAVETLDIADPKRLASAIVEIAADEAERNARFAERVKTLYAALTPAKPVKAATKSAKGAKGPKLLPADITPIKHVEGRPFDIGAPPGPYFLLDIFGPAQLPRVLAMYSVQGLQDAVAIVQERHPNAKPKGKTKAALVEFLVSHVGTGK